MYLPETMSFTSHTVDHWLIFVVAYHSLFSLADTLVPTQGLSGENQSAPVGVNESQLDSPMANRTRSKVSSGPRSNAVGQE